MLFFLFGHPGCGKNYVGEIFRDFFGFYFYDGDEQLTAGMKEIMKIEILPYDLREEFYERVVEEVVELDKRHDKLVISQALPFQKHRDLILEDLPHAKFLWIKADPNLIQQRLSHRAGHHVDSDYSKRLQKVFEPPYSDISIIVNNTDQESVIEQIKNNILTFSRM
ncbi:MAG: shikimate kinase [Candidatus Omnitrophota bacterium]|nr:hypothetical protein [Patescibacteria group bacterium]MBU2509599.1 hypothetical protein [Patescibacteria group bacterium]